MYRQSEKNLLNSNISSTCPHNMANFSALAAEIGSGVWGTPANFNGFHVLASLPRRLCFPEANQTLHDVWPSPGLLHYIYIFGSSCPLAEFCHVQNSLCVQVLPFYRAPGNALQFRPSVRPSVTRRYSVKTTARSTVQFALSDSKMCLVL